MVQRIIIRNAPMLLGSGPPPSIWPTAGPHVMILEMRL